MARFKITFCLSNKTFHVLNCVCLVLVYAAQSIILNSYMISYSENTWPSSLWYAGDLILVCLFIATSAKAYIYLAKKKLERKADPVSQNDTRVTGLYNINSIF